MILFMSFEGELSGEEIEKRHQLRKLFDEAIKEIMQENGYDDIDEGKFEAITESDVGSIKLYRGNDYDVWGYRIEHGGVVLIKLWDSEEIKKGDINGRASTYPSKIGADEYIIKDGKIIACKKFQRRD